jgi:hypothetical protein
MQSTAVNNTAYTGSSFQIAAADLIRVLHATHDSGIGGCNAKANSTYYFHQANRSLPATAVASNSYYPRSESSSIQSQFISSQHAGQNQRVSTVY